MQSAFVDIGLERDAFLYVSDFFEDTEEYEKIVSTVEDEVAELQEVSRIKTATAVPITPPPTVPASPEFTAELPIPTGIQPIPGEVFSEAERPESSPTGLAGPSGPAAHEDFDRRGGRGRRDRDRRGKKPKIPSFESKSYEPRPDERTYTGLEVLPGESLAKLALRVEHEPERGSEELEKNASLGALAEEPPTPAETDAASRSPSPIPPETNEGGIATAEPSVHEDAARVSGAPEAHTTESASPKEAQESDQEAPSSARITERTDRYQFAHRSSGRRARRG